MQNAKTVVLSNSEIEQILKQTVEGKDLKKILLLPPDPARLQDGYQTVDGEEIFYVSTPAIGLWTCD